MKLFGTILLASTIYFKGQAAEETKTLEATHRVVISTDYLDRLVAEALAHNVSLQAAHSRLRAAVLNAEAVRTWEDPTAFFGGSVYSEKGFNPSEEGNLAYGIEQKLPLWGRPTLMRKVATAETSVREAELNYRAHRLRSDLTKELVLIALAEAVVEIGEQDLAWLGATAKATENKYRAGQAAMADTLQIQNDVAKRTDALRTERTHLAHERVTLNRLLNRDAAALWPSFSLPPIAPEIPLSAKLLALALENEPRIKVSEQVIRQAGASAELTRKSRLPEVSLGVEGRQYTGDGGLRSGMFTLRCTLPWANGNKYRKDYERDQAKQRSAEQEREDQVSMVREELHHLAVGVEVTRREALLQSGEITIRASQALTSRLSEWESGRGTFRDVLDARRMLLESQLMSVRATAEQQQMLAEMLLWSGLENLESLLSLAGEPPVLRDHERHEK